MLVNTKAKVGVFSIALGAYLPQFPSLVPEFEAQYDAFKKTIPDTVEIVDGGMVTTKESCALNLTNEGGYAGRFRYLKNIMGLWMIQSVRHEINDKYGFAEICAMAEEAKDFPSRVDANDECFLAPANMTEEVKDYCRRTGQKVPETLGEIATVIYTSLAECYAKTAKELEEITGRTYSRIHVVGGGSNAGYLNELTAKATGKEVHAGPGEATAIGNITAQMLKAEEFKTIEEARTVIHESFNIKIYHA